MGEKYLQSKSGSLEDLATQIASKQSEIKVEQKVKLETPKTYLGIKENSVTAVAARVVAEASDYQAKFKSELEKSGKSIGQMSDTEKKAFFNKIDKEYKAKNETHTFMTDKMNKRQKDAKGEKEIIKPIKEGRMKEVAIDLKDLSAEEFKKKYGESKAEMQKKLGKPEAVKEPYAVGMAAAMKAKKDKPPLEKSTITKAHDIAKAIMKKEQDISKAAVDKFHTKLDKLVHKSFGHSSAEKKVKTEKKTFSNLKAEVEKGKKTMTGGTPAVIDTEPRTQHI